MTAGRYRRVSSLINSAAYLPAVMSTLSSCVPNPLCEQTIQGAAPPSSGKVGPRPDRVKALASIARPCHGLFYFEPVGHTRLSLGIFFWNSKIYPPDNIGMMTTKFPFSMRLSKLPTFLSMRIMTFSSGKEEGKIRLNGVGLSKFKFFVRAPATSAR